jgi:hypothetical protein
MDYFGDDDELTVPERKLALAEYCMQGEAVFYQDPGTACDA